MGTESVARACVIGAGPYGLAVAAHLRHAGVTARVFGSAMRRWFEQMPLTNFLKSDGCASSLPDPVGQLTLPAFCREQQLPYSEIGAPVERDTFIRYGIEFQRRLVPHLENVYVRAVRRSGHMFEVELASGETIRTEAVIASTGMDYMEYVPPALTALPRELRSHTADYSNYSQLSGKEVAVVGGGQSALEAAAMLSEQGASPTLVVRNHRIIWGDRPNPAQRPLHRRLRHPRTNLGYSPQHVLYERAPQLFHYLPRALRLARVKVELGPAGAWWLRDRVDGKVPLLLERSVTAATARGARVALHLSTRNQVPEELLFDHVIAATGYEFRLQNLPYLDADLKAAIRCEGTTPVLSGSYEASVPGTYFTGIASANSFGPAMRFVVGTGHTARQIAADLSRGRWRSTAFSKQPRCLEA
jgi:FAD-dependent urate hydroxylase